MKPKTALRIAAALKTALRFAMFGPLLTSLALAPIFVVHLVFWENGGSLYEDILEYSLINIVVGIPAFLIFVVSFAVFTGYALGTVPAAMTGLLMGIASAKTRRRSVWIIWSLAVGAIVTPLCLWGVGVFVDMSMLGLDGLWAFPSAAAIGALGGGLSGWILKLPDDPRASRPHAERVEASLVQE